MNRVVEAFKLQSNEKTMSSLLLSFLKSVKIRRKSFSCVVVIEFLEAREGRHHVRDLDRFEEKIFVNVVNE